MVPAAAIAPRPKLAAPATRLADGAAGTLARHRYQVAAHAIVEIARVSKPGRRVYSSISDLKPVKNGLGISILSTPKGVMSDTAAREANVGGEVLCRVY
jgi:ribosomal protein S8